MKKMFAKLGMPSVLSLVFLLGGLLFGSTSASAQSTTISPQGASPIKTTGTWKSVDAAKAALLSEINNLMQVLNGSPANFNQLKMKLTIYRDIVVELENGNGVPQSALASYNQYKPGVRSTATEVPVLTANEWLVIYTDMINLLQV